MSNNQRTVTCKLQRIELCDLLLACSAAHAAAPEALKWIALHDKIETTLKEFDDKHTEVQ